MTETKKKKRTSTKASPRKAPKKLTEQEVKDLYELDAIDHKVIHYLINYPAMKKTEMMCLLGIGKWALETRLRKPAVRKAIQDINQSAYDMMSKAQTKAVRKLMNMMDSPDEDIVIKACRIVMQPLINHATIDISEKKDVTFKVRFGEQGQMFSEMVEEKVEDRPSTLDLLQ